MWVCIYFDMKYYLHFVDGCIYYAGRPIRSATLVEGKCISVCYLGEVYGWGRIEVKRGHVLAPNFAVVAWGNHYQLRYLAAAEEVVAQQSVEYNRVRYTATLCRSPGMTLWIEGAEGGVAIALPFGESSLSYHEEFLAWTVEQKRENGAYLLVASIEGEVLFRGLCTDYRLADTLCVSCTYADLRRHQIEKTYGYRNGEFVMIEQRCIGRNEHICISSLPRLFLEALAVGEREEARGYLTAELAASEEDLWRYVGEIESVLEPYGKAPKGSIAAVGEGIGKLFLFTVEGERIADVQRIEDEFLDEEA